MDSDEPVADRVIDRRQLLKAFGVGAVAAPLSRAIAATVGPRAAAAASTDATTVGEWAAPVTPLPIIGVHAIVLHTNEVLLVQNTAAYVWKPSSGAATQVNPPKDLFCSGHTVLGNGDVLFAGGFVSGSIGPKWVFTFRPSTRTWTRRPDMREGRYYPTVITLPGGNGLITGGTDSTGAQINQDVELFANGKLTVVGTRNVGMYPNECLMPNGSVVTVAGAAIGALALTGTAHLLDRATWSWSALPAPAMKRTYPCGVLLPGGRAGSYKVMLFGGKQSGVPLDVTERFDAANATAGWTLTAPLPQAREQMNAVILPDGTVLGVGGTNRVGAQREAILYNPATNSWQTLAAQAEERGYHSTAVLLAGGKVLSAGDNLPPGGGAKIEVFSPPYLFRGPRPTITSAPLSIALGGSFTIGTGGSVQRVVLVRPGAVTHTQNSNQRHVELAFSPVTSGVSAAVPSSSNIVPLGYYMLFVLSDLGVPSFGKWVKVVLPV